jgi:hypothetical protein
LSLLEKYGGVWIDSTLLGFHQLDTWVNEELLNAGIWMYHGNGAKLSRTIGPASWFIIAKKNNYIISKWKSKCDEYWHNRISTNNYFWMDYLFRELLYNDEKFKKIWNDVPYLFCESDVQSHYLSKYERMHRNNSKIKNKLEKKPPFVLKLSLSWQYIFDQEIFNEKLMSNGFFAYKLSLKNSNWPKHTFFKKNTLKFIYSCYYSKFIDIFNSPFYLVDYFFYNPRKFIIYIKNVLKKLVYVALLNCIYH